MDWSDDGIEEEDQPSLRSRAARPRSPPGGRPLPPPGARASSGGSGSRAPSPQHGGLTLTPAGSRSSSPRRAGIMATRMGSSVRTTSRSPPRRRTSGDDDTGVEEVIAKMREGLPVRRDGAGTSAAGASGSGGGGPDPQQVAGGASGGFSFRGIELEPATPLDGGEVLDNFVGSEEARKAKAAAEFLEATMGANTGPRTEALKMELVANRRVLDLAGLERWMRRTEAVAELEWFTDLMCCDEKEEPPEVDLFECAFRALENAAADELRRGADARRRWIGLVGVPEFFFCPVSDKVMENPVVVATGKTVDGSALEEWRSEHGRICPVTGEVLAHTMFIPNILIKLCIARWRASNNIWDEPAASDPAAIPAESEALFKELTLMPHSPRSSGAVRSGLFVLHALLLGNEGAYVPLFGLHPGTITKFASVLAETCLDPDPELDGIIVGLLEKAASYGPNKAAFGDDQYAVPVLIARSLLGPVPMRARCADILGQLSDDHYNRIKIGELGGFAPLVELLYVGDQGVKKTAAKAISNLGMARENMSRFRREGAVDAIISAVRSDRGLMTEAQAVLMMTTFSRHAIREAMSKLDAHRGNDMCDILKVALHRTFRQAKPEGKLSVVSSMPDLTRSSTSTSGKSSTSSEGSAAEKALRKQIKEDVGVIVSWLQKRRYFPRTYRYRKE
ncbi:hypothetical protein BS78_06G057300 [Paspalum vaginatum]|nr:hypothetical protein BS78_06G057300 [Paspalum vaginatum]